MKQKSSGLDCTLSPLKPNPEAARSPGLPDSPPLVASWTGWPKEGFAYTARCNLGHSDACRARACFDFAPTLKWVGEKRQIFPFLSQIASEAIQQPNGITFPSYMRGARICTGDGCGNEPFYHPKGERATFVKQEQAIETLKGKDCFPALLLPSPCSLPLNPWLPSTSNFILVAHD